MKRVEQNTGECYIDIQKNNCTASSVGNVRRVQSPPCFPSARSGNACEINFLNIY